MILMSRGFCSASMRSPVSQHGNDVTSKQIEIEAQRVYQCVTFCQNRIIIINRVKNIRKILLCLNPNGEKHEIFVCSFHKGYK